MKLFKNEYTAYEDRTAQESVAMQVEESRG